MALDEAHTNFIEENFPVPYNTPETYRDFILPKLQQHDTLCTAVISEVKKNILLPLMTKYKNRFFCRIDADHKIKQPISIIDKIMRPAKSESGKPVSEPHTLDNFTTTMKDLARFRIVCNFIHDVDEVAESLNKSEALNNMFSIEPKTTMNLHPISRKSAERSVKFILEHKKLSGLFLEIQVMTQLSEAWDKKDHFLVYEVRRRDPDKESENFPDYLDAKMHAMGELLYVADSYFEALRESQEADDKEETNRS